PDVRSNYRLLRHVRCSSSLSCWRSPAGNKCSPGLLRVRCSSSSWRFTSEVVVEVVNHFGSDLGRAFAVSISICVCGRSTPHKLERLLLQFLLNNWLAWARNERRRERWPI